MDVFPFEFWRQVYIAAIRSGRTNVDAKAVADRAVKDYEEAVHRK